MNELRTLRALRGLPPTEPEEEEELRGSLSVDSDEFPEIFMSAHKLTIAREAMLAREARPARAVERARQFLAGEEVSDKTGYDVDLGLAEFVAAARTPHPLLRVDEKEGAGVGDLSLGATAADEAVADAEEEEEVGSEVAAAAPRFNEYRAGVEQFFRTFINRSGWDAAWAGLSSETQLETAGGGAGGPLYLQPAEFPPGTAHWSDERFLEGLIVLPVSIEEETVNGMGDEEDEDVGAPAASGAATGTVDVTTFQALVIDLEGRKLYQVEWREEEASGTGVVEDTTEDDVVVVHEIPGPWVTAFKGVTWPSHNWQDGDEFAKTVVERFCLGPEGGIDTLMTESYPLEFSYSAAIPVASLKQ